MRTFLKILLLAAAIGLQAKEVFSFGSDTPWQKSSPFGKFSISKDNIISLDGKSGGIALDTKLLHSPKEGITLLAVAKVVKNPEMSKDDTYHQALFCRKHQFLMALDFGRFYVNFHNGKKWFTPLLVNVRSNDNQFHSYVMTVKRTFVESQGDDYLTVKMYFDGKLVLERKVHNAVVADSTGEIDVGCARSCGKVWYFGGELLDVRAYNKVLSDYDIEDYTAKFKEIKNQPQRSMRINDTDLKLLQSLPDTGSAQLLAAVSAVKNLASKTAKFNWQKVAANLKKGKINNEILSANGFYQYKSGNAILTVAAGKGYADAVSLFDTVNNRELLMHDNPFFRLLIKNDKFSPLTADAVSEFVRIDDKKFTIKYKFKNASAFVNFDCSKDKIHYSMTAVPGKNISFDNVEFPALELKNLSQDAALFAPVMSGVEHPAAVKNNITYDLEYPRGIASMQYGAFYDEKGGIFWSPADKLARTKQLQFVAGANRLKVVYQWYPVQNSAFDPGCPVRLELFKGNWFEAAMLYKQLMHDIKPLYWVKQPLPRKDSPEWLKNNTLWFLHGSQKLTPIAQYRKIREYIGLPFAIHLYRWNGKTFDRDYPHHRGLPSFLDLIAECHSMGIRMTPYINGRLWESLDRREEDYLYSKKGKGNFVLRKDGTVAMTIGKDIKFGIICPYTPVYDDLMRKSCFMLEKMGIDGIYIDQIGAAAHIVCYDKNHGHAVPDDTAWFEKGHHKVFSKIRAEMKTRSPEVILTTEDNAETCIRDFDALLCWRWMYKGQVPAFSAVYSGRTQLIGLTYDLPNRDEKASFAKAAWQVIGGGQIGWFHKEYLLAPEKHDFRVWVKQLMRMRLALLDFFNEGEMAKPAKFSMPVKEEILFWAQRGSVYVNTPELYSTTWRKGNIHALILTNNTRTTVANSLTFQPGKKGKVYCFDNCGNEKVTDYDNIVKHDFELKPHVFQILLTVPENEDADDFLDEVRRQFKLLATFWTEHDPFVKEQPQIAVYDPLSWITNVRTARFECQFFPGAMYPTAFTLKNGMPLPAVNFRDNVKIGNDVYYLDCDRWAESKVIENTKERFVIELYGTFCTSAREYAAKDLKAVYRYTFDRKKPEVDIEAKVIMPADSTAVPELLQLSCDQKNSRISWKTGEVKNQQNIFSCKGKILIK